MTKSQDDPREQIRTLEARIEELAQTLASCRKLIWLSKVMIAAGAVAILAIIFGVIAFDPVVMSGAIAAVLGGIVLFGSNTSTLQQSTAALRAAEWERNQLIGEIELRPIDDRAAAKALPPIGNE
jgi:hypothetical protein